jgi:hypothetical protein
VNFKYTHITASCHHHENLKSYKNLTVHLNIFNLSPVLRETCKNISFTSSSWFSFATKFYEVNKENFFFPYEDCDMQPF